MLRILAVLVASLAGSACLPSNYFAIHPTYDPDAATATDTGDSSTDASTGDDPLPTTTAEPGSTGEPGTTGTEEDSTTAAPPPGEPQAFDPSFDPDPLTAPGAIIVTVQTADADAVTLAVDGGPEQHLVPGPNGFTTTLFYYSSLANGEHTAVFTPSFKDQTGDPLDAVFIVDMPAGGGEVFWEAAPTLGKGRVAAVAALPDGTVAEFGTLLDGIPTCYVRRRTSTGGWTPDDVQILPETPCKAIDLGVSSDGALYLLADREGLQDLSWWLGRSQKFGAPPTNLRWGSPGEKAYALAMHPEKAAVCGTQPAPKVDIQAAAWVYGFDDPGITKSFDYEGPKHKIFDETPSDCAFRNDTLVMTGIVRGKHGLQNPNPPPLDRLFILETALNATPPVWFIDGDPDSTAQSGAQALAIDPAGRAFVGAYTCGLPCVASQTELRAYELDQTLSWTMPLAPNVTPLEDLAWSPAGYVVAVSAVDLGNWTSSFFVQAWKPGSYPAVWTYTKNVSPTLHVASAVAIGRFGQVCTAGVGSNGYPAVAFIHP